MALLLAVQPDPLLFRELTLLGLQLVRYREEALLDPLLAHHLVQKRQVVSEEEDGVRVEHPGVRSELLREKDGRHGGHVLVREADVRAEEACLAWFRPVGADPVGSRVHDPLAREDLLAEGHGAGLRGL